MKVVSKWILILLKIQDQNFKEHDELFRSTHTVEC